MNKRKLLRITAIFFAFMLCFTVLSRAADQMSVAVVVTARPENKMITHDILASGKVVQNQELAVTTEPDQRVKAIYVNEGDRVQKGDLLFEIDLTLLEEKILAQQQEMEKQSLSVQDAKSQKDVSAQQKANQQAQASEQYSLSTHSAGVRLSRAKEALDTAKKELERFRKKNPAPAGDSGVEEALMKTCEEKAEDYIQAQQELTQVQWKIENAVNMALQSAGSTVSASAEGRSGLPESRAGDAAVQNTLSENGSVLEENPEILTGAAQEAVEAVEATEATEASSAAVTIEDEPDIVLDSESDGETVDSAAVMSDGTGGGDDLAGAMPQDDAGASLGDSSDIIVEESEVVGDSTGDIGTGGSGLDGDGGANGDISGNGTAGNGSENSGSDNAGAIGGNAGDIGTGGDSGVNGDISGNGTAGNGSENSGSDNAGDISGNGSDIIIEELPQDDNNSPEPQPPTQEELAQLEQSVRDRYASELSAAQQKVDTALKEKQEAENALAAYQQEQMAASSAQNAESEKQLIANVKAAQQAYEDAAIAANEAAVTSGRAVATAGIPDASNSSDRMNEITYEQMELQLQKLEALKEADGKVTAPADGLITKIQIMTGEKTTDTTALLMADLSKGYRFSAEITKEQEEYIGTGDLVTLRGSSKKQVLEELPVESVTQEEENESIYCVTVQLPQEQQMFEIGAGATLEYSKKSEAYPVCVPLSALRLDEKNQPYVLVPEQYDSVLGTQIKARKVSVTVQEKNESYAALAEGGLSSQQEVIISSDKAIDEGSRVRVTS